MMSSNDFVKNYNLKIKATSNIKLQQVLGSIGLDSVGIYLRHGPFKTDIGIVNSHPTKGTHWVSFINEIYFDSYGFFVRRDCVNFLKIEMDFVYILNIRYKKTIVFVRDFVCI